MAGTSQEGPRWHTLIGSPYTYGGTAFATTAVVTLNNEFLIWVSATTSQNGATVQILGGAIIPLANAPGLQWFVWLSHSLFRATAQNKTVVFTNVDQYYLSTAKQGST